MARKVRFYGLLPYFQEITCRCYQGRLLLTPDCEEVNEAIGGILAALINKHKVKVLALSFLSNHYHMIAKGPTKKPGQLSKFMKDFNKQLSDEIGSLHNWPGAFWQARFENIPIVDIPALKRRLIYVLSHGLKEGFVQSCASYPCFNSWPEHCGEKRIFTRHGKKYALKLAKLPAALLRVKGSTVHLSEKAWFKALEQRIDADAPLMAPGPEFLKSQQPHQIHKLRQYRRKPICHYTHKRSFRHFMKEREQFETEYHQASEQFRCGNCNVTFPPHSFPPVLGSNWNAQVLKLDKRVKLVGRMLPNGDIEFSVVTRE